MQRILLIEPSATPRYVLKRYLRNSGYTLDIESGIQVALDRLLSEPPQTYAAIIFGWPGQNRVSSDELLVTLCEPAFEDLAVIVTAQESDSAKLAWVGGRKHTALVLWDNLKEVEHALDRLLTLDPVLDNADQLFDHAPIRVLLVDDSPTARVRFRRLLQGSGYITFMASSAEEALAISESEAIDLAIIDYFMPNMTGEQLCRKFQESVHTTGIMTAILTGTYSNKVISMSLAAGAVECMFKNEADELFLARVVAMSRQVQARRRVEQERQRLDGILSSVGDGVYGVSQEGVITFVNPAAVRILGFRRAEQMLGKDPAVLFHKSYSNHPSQEMDAHHLYKCIRNGDSVHSVESVFSRADKKLIQVELTVYPLRIEGRQEGAVIAFRDITERKLLEEELKWQVNHDSLTKLLNRKFFEDALDQEVRRLKRSDEQSALIYVDLDRFKYVNDTAGHTVGDQLLIEISQLLRSRQRQADLLARLGGDEFAIIMRNIKGYDLQACADVFRKQLSDFDFVHDGRVYKIAASIGVALIDKHTASPGEALANADIACHLAKRAGRNQTHIFKADTDDKTAMDLELGWSTRLRNALDQNAFKLFYQPILPLATVELGDAHRDNGELWSEMVDQGIPRDALYEVLLRLPDGNDRPIAPGAFLPTAERFNMMPEIDYWVVENALAYQARLHTAGIHAGLSVNLSGQSLDSDHIIKLVKSGLNKYQLDPATLVFEITETSAIFNIESAQRVIGELSEYGCRFALDDFGSGYCSFSHLKNLPVEIIKIDGMFIKDLINDPMDMAIIRSINDIAHSLGKKTVAECVENQVSFQLLKECGVDYVQGYYISPPLDTVPQSEEQRRQDPFASGLLSLDTDFLQRPPSHR